jgi:hypothetical protein
MGNLISCTHYDLCGGLRKYQAAAVQSIQKRNVSGKSGKKSALLTAQETRPMAGVNILLTNFSHVLSFDRSMSSGV